MATKPFPFKWEELTAEETARIKADFPESAVNDLVRYEQGLIMPRNFIGIDERLYNFTLRDDDIWIVTYPKVGTTWTQEMVWMLVNNVDDCTIVFTDNSVRESYTPMILWNIPKILW